jgi:serine protease Do
VVAQAVPAGSAAQRAGLRAGDVIVAVGGTPIEHVGQFQRLIAGNHPGDEVTLDVVRYGTAKRMTVKLMEAPSAQVAEAPAHAPATPGGMGGLGISAGPLTGTAARQLGYTDGRGVLLAAVTPLGAGYRAGLRRDMRILAVDGRAVASAADLASALGRRGADDVVSLIVGYPGPDPQQAILNVRLPR